jgi:hypothetical protein
VAKGPAQIDIPIEHEQRLTGMGYIEFGLGWLRLTDAGKARLAKGG